ncbi:rhodanese-like domain-containing protein [Gordonia hirsuta]|nr:rhodanese-like domain-containing protein [Gordonia hirsuta]
MTVFRRFDGLLAALLLGIAVLAGCSTPAEQDPAAALGPDTTVIDVRTPAEFAQGHLTGAMNIDLQSAAFDQEIGRLDRSGSYLVYCRSGNRSAYAAQVMSSMGFTDVRDAGSLGDAGTLTGLAIVAE